MGVDRTEGTLPYEGWAVVAASAIAVFFVSIFFFTFPVFLKPLANEFAWSREAISAAYAALTLGSALSAPLIGFLVDRWEPRWICSVCLTVAGCAFASLGMLADRLWLWYGAFALIGVASAGTSSVVYSRVICSWFEEHRGRALAVMIAGSALGGIVVPPIAQALIDGVGWRNAYLALGAGIPILAVPVVVRWVRERASREPAVVGRTRAAVRAALRSRTLWTLLVVVFGTTVTINGAIVHLSALLTDRGMTASRAALVVSAMGVASLVGRLIAGWLLDRFVATRVAFVLLAMAATGTFVLARAESFTAGMIAATLIGFGTGGEVDVIPYLLSRYFGLAALSTLFGISWLAFGLAGAVGPIAMGRAHDATGSYDVVLAYMAVGTLAIAALILSLPPYDRRARPETAEPL